MHDRSGTGLLQCSSGAVSATGTLHLDPISQAAAGPAGPEGGGWCHATLELEGGKVTWAVKQLENTMVEASEAPHAVRERIRALRAPEEEGGGGAAEAGADAAAVALPGADQGAADAGSGPAAAAAAEAASGAAAEGQALASGSSGDMYVDVPLEGAVEEEGQKIEEGALAPSVVCLRLSYRPLQQPPSAAVETKLAAALEAAAAGEPGKRRAFIRLVSMRPLNGLSGSEADGGTAQGGEAAVAAEAAASEAVAEEDEEEAAGAVQQGLPLELPLEPLPRHLHAYGHGGERGWLFCRLPACLPVSRRGAVAQL